MRRLDFFSEELDDLNIMSDISFGICWKGFSSELLSWIKFYSSSDSRLRTSAVND